MKRKWTLAEKSLFAAPLLFCIITGAIYMARQAIPVVLELPDRTEINNVSFSPDGKRLAVFFGDSFPYNTGQVFDLEKRVKIADLDSLLAGHPGSAFYTPSWSPDSSQIMSGFFAGLGATTMLHASQIGGANSAVASLRVAIWNAATGRLSGNYFYKLTKNSSNQRLHFSDDGNRIIGNDKVALNASSGVCVQVFDGDFPDASQIEINEKLGLGAALNEDKTHLQVFDLKSKKVFWKTSIGLIDSIQWPGDILAIVYRSQSKPGIYNNGHRILLWNAKTRTTLPAPTVMPQSSISDLNFSDDQKTLVFCNWKQIPSQTELKADSQIVCYDYRVNRALWTYSTTYFLSWVQVSPDGKWVSAVTHPTYDKPQSLLVFDTTGKLSLEREVVSEATRWSPDSTQIAMVVKTGKTTKQIVLVRMRG